MGVKTIALFEQLIQISYSCYFRFDRIFKKNYFYHYMISIFFSRYFANDKYTQITKDSICFCNQAASSVYEQLASSNNEIIFLVFLCHHFCNLVPIYVHFFLDIFTDFDFSEEEKSSPYYEAVQQMKNNEFESVVEICNKQIENGKPMHIAFITFINCVQFFLVRDFSRIFVCLCFSIPYVDQQSFILTGSIVVSY